MTTPRPITLGLYALAADAAAPLTPMILSRRAGRGKEDPARIGERLGRASLPRPTGHLAWMHGASVGEGLSLLPLIDRLRSLRPDVAIMVTTGTVTSARVLAERLPPGVIHQFAPIDTPAAVRRFIGHWRPNLGVFVESELWPNLIWTARASGARLALVSAKMSGRSLSTWRRWPNAARAILGAFDLILARDLVAGERFVALGAHVDGVWDAKLGALPLPADERELARLREALAERPVILAASTHAGEDALVARAFARAAGAAPAPLLVIVPRHPVRGQEAADAMRTEGLSVARRTAGEDFAAARVLIADTLGELGLWYRLARLAVVGGSLVDDIGGHNPLEPARLDCPFIAGPHVEHWPIYRDLANAGATHVLDSEAELATWFSNALKDDPALGVMAAKAADYAARRDEEGAAVVPRLLALLEP